MPGYAAFRVRAAFDAAAERARAPRLAALFFVWSEIAWELAVDFDSRFRPPETARERVDDVLRFGFRPAAESRAAFFRRAEDPFGGRSFTPARRALESPIAIAC